MTCKSLVEFINISFEGVIVNVSSGCCLTPSMYGCLYAATKVCHIYQYKSSFLWIIFLFLNFKLKFLKFLISTPTFLNALQTICTFFYHFHFKSFANFFTWGLQRECAPYGIKVQVITPFIVTTKLVNYSKSKNIFTPDAETYARWAVFTLGKTYETTGYFWHAIQVRS